MAVSPADFYAYSRATGAPVPEDPEERAAMAPEVLEFRRNQLKAPSDEGNALQTLGAVALAGAAALGAGLAGRRFLRGRQQLPKAPAKSATAGVVQQDLSAIRRIAEIPAPTVKESKVVSPSAPAPTTTENALPVDPTDRLLGELQEMRAARQKTTPLEVTGEELSNYALARLKGVRPATPALTDIQESLGQQAQSQFINAVESGEDQITGRINAQLQRNEDFDFKEGVLTDRLPEDQTQVNQAQTFLQEQRQKISAGLSPTRRERALAANPEIAEAAELYASTGDPAVLSRLSATPSSPLTVRPAVQTELKREEIPLGMFYEAKPKFEFTEPLEDKDINLTNRISSLGAEQQRVRNRLQEIDETEPMLRYAMASEGPEGGEYSKMYNTLQYEKSQLPDPESFNADLSDAIEERNYVRRQIQSLQDLGPKYEMINRQEGVRPFYETTAEGQIIPETLEIRTGRPSVDIGPKSGGGRQFSAYDPDTALKSSVGIYGVEPRDFPIADPGMKPTMLLPEERKATLRRKPESGPAVQEYIDKTRRMRMATPEQRKSSLEVSEALRRATIEGRDPQMVLRNLGFNV